MRLIYRVFLLGMEFEDILDRYRKAKGPPQWFEDDMSALFIKLGHIKINEQTAAALIYWVLIVELCGDFEDASSDSESDSDTDSDTEGSLAVKASLRMNISGYDLMCTIKATVVLLWDPTKSDFVLAIDFARRSGDALCFGEVFKKAREYIGAVTVDSNGHISRPALLRSEPVHVCTELCTELCKERQVVTHEAALQPLVAMLEDSSSPVLQQEAITELSAIANTSAANMAVVSSALANSMFKDIVLNTL